MPKFISNGVAGTLAIRWGLRGPNFNPVSACASGAHAIGEALWMIRRGDADLMLARTFEDMLHNPRLAGNALAVHGPGITLARPLGLGPERRLLPDLVPVHGAFDLHSGRNHFQRPVCDSILEPGL